jgi:GNAT superfamily N-acetyltransferase
MSPSLSSSPDLAQIKRQAKELLKAQKAGDPAVCGTLRKVRRFAEMSDDEVLRADIKLAEAQHATAKDYGFNTWADLKRHVSEQGEAAAKPVPVRREDLLLGVTIRHMTREDLGAMRRFDTELAATLDKVNAEHPPGGYLNVPGGPWSDDQWLLEHFENYQAHGNTTLLAEEANGRIVGFADLWTADEPAPFGCSLDVECIDSFREYYLAGLETKLLSAAEKIAREKGLPALDIGTNTCGGDFVSLRRFGMRVFYEYDNLTCSCRAGLPKLEHRRVASKDVDVSGLIKVNHWSPTDFTFRDEEEPTCLAEFTVADTRAIVELWCNNPDGLQNLPVPENPPNKSELFVEPRVLSSCGLVTEALEKCLSLAAELGAEQIQLPCPSDIQPNTDRLDIAEREFAFAWLRKGLL